MTQEIITSNDIREMIESETTHEIVTLDANSYRAFLHAHADSVETFTFSIACALAKDVTNYSVVMRSQSFDSVNACLVALFDQIAIDVRELSLEN